MLVEDKFEGVVQLRLSRVVDSRPVYWVACYLVEGLLIDSGPACTAAELAARLDASPPHTLVNTHFHEDHVGGNKIVAQRFGARVYAHPDSIGLINSKPHLYPYQEFAWGYPEPFLPQPLPEKISAGPFTFTFMETPGHSLGHVAVLEMDRGWCFSGDIFARETPKFVRPEEDMCKTVESMKKLMALPMERLVLFTSVGKIIPQGRQALARCVDYLEELAVRAQSHAAKGMDADAIVINLFGGEHPFAEMTNNQYRVKNLVKSLLEMKAG